ncbi:MAG: DEAD/DEAH box helicase [Bacillota bacterium]
MKISEIYSAMGLKIKLCFEDETASFKEGVLIRIEPSQSQDKQVFLVSQYGEGIVSRKTVLCKASSETADYLLDLFDGERNGAYRCMFLVDGGAQGFIDVQTYIFQSVTEYKSAINIIVPEKILETYSLERLQQEYVWTQLGMPALFCLNYKNKKKQNANIRFLGGKRFLIATNTARGIVAESVAYIKDKYDVPVDVYVAPEVKFVAEADVAEVNDKLSADLDRISNPSSYFARWEAYEALSKKLLEAESAEFGELAYSSYTIKSEPTGITFEFKTNEELDDSFKGKELGASEKEDPTDNDSSDNSKRQMGVGQIKKISGTTITTFLEGEESPDTIPSSGVLRLYTAGDRSIMKRRLAARNRMVNHQAPIKSIVALIETGTSGFELLNAWGSHKPITEKLRRNFIKAKDLNPEQIAALELAINTPDIALIQGPPGTGKTTVIKAICERFREIFENEEKQRQRAKPDYILRSPKILISSFQNEAVDNAISAPLPGDIPAFRKTAKRAKDSSKEQYQKALEKWYSGLRSSLLEMIEDETAPEFLEAKKSLGDEFLSYKNAGQPIEKAAALIDRYLSYVEIPYPQDTVAAAKAIIASVSAGSDEEDVDPVIKRIEAQRTTKDAFADDGERNARRLSAYLRVNDDLEIPESIIEAIDAVGYDEFTESEFATYVQAVEQLRTRFCKNRVRIDPKDQAAVEECILTLANFFNRHYLSTLTSIESKKSLILSDFLSRLEQEYETIVSKYSMTTAATCQTCLDLRDGINKTYDLVIVDEAARANPLDLFIPMSMGKKIILVGDHKQLPHMLEPDVLKMLTDDPNFKDIPEIEKSLFERLFEMFSKGPKPKAIPLTHQYRMHPDICSFVSDSFYDGLLKTASSVTPELRSSPEDINNGKALTFVNVPLAKGSESRGVSKSRWAEAEMIGKDVRRILNTVPDASIGIITFYAAQTQLIKRNLDSLLNDEEKANIEVGTVDAFQGKEFDYVLLSCVRANAPKDGKPPVVGFLEKPNRLCVAFSRSIRQLAVYGDVETLMQIPCFAKLYEICAVNGGGCYREC